MAKRAVGVRKRGAKWQWRATVNGVERTGTAATEAEATIARANALTASTSPLGFEPTIADVLAWADHSDLSETARRRNETAEKRIPTNFLDMRAVDFGPRRTLALWRQMVDSGEAPSTIEKAGQVLSRAWQQAANRELVPMVNPFRVVRAPKAPQPESIDIPAADDVQLALKLTVDMRPYGALLRLMAVTGMRPGEASGIKWSDINDHSIRIQRSINQYGNVTPGKTFRRGHRTVTVDEATLKAMKAQRIVGCDWCFTFDGRKPVTPKLVYRAVKRSQGSKENPHHSIHKPYLLRHFAASQAILAGLPITEVAEMLGDNPATVLRTYAHVVPGRDSAALSVARALDGG